MSGRLAGKVAWVTGASRGIGQAIAMAYAAEGAQVVISSRKLEGLNAVSDEMKSQGTPPANVIQCHMGRENEITDAVSQITHTLGVPDIVVNNAGTSPYFGPFIEAPTTLWDKTFEVNLKGPFWTTREVAQRCIAEKKSCSIVNIASIQGQLGAPFQGVYAMTKSALISMTQTMALELGSHGIRVNAIAPGLVQTRLASALTDHPEFARMYTDRTALKRYGQPNEIAGLAVFLGSDESSYLSGQAIAIDGGYTAA